LNLFGVKFLRVNMNMNMKSWKKSLLAPAMIGAAVLVPTVASANEVLGQADAYNQESGNMAQVTSVSQLSDVKPTDWAFQALQSLVERYGCIVGYPDRTYRGNRALTRYEFAAGLNACMDRVNELIAAGTGDVAKKEDLETLKKLQEEFAAELATLRGRVDSLEGKVATLEKQQFSTTTKLRGEVIYSVAGALGDQKANSLASIDENTTFAYRARLGLVTSFNGKDQLFTRLQARNIPNFQAATGTNMARLAYEGGGTTGGGVDLDKLYYRFNLNPNVRFTIDAIGAEYYGNVDPLNPGLASDSTGSISRFGRFNPIYRYGAGGSGVTANVKLGDKFSVDAGYLADNAANPSPENGLTNGSFAALGQINFKPTKDLGVAFTYIRGYDRGAGNAISVTGATGSALANQPFGGIATSSDNFGIQASFRLNPSINLAGWAGLTKAENRINTAQDATIWNWAVAASFPDLGKKGNLGGLIFGMPPKVTDASGGAAQNNDTSYHLEALYRYQLNDKISITPGLVVLFNPEHNKNNDTIYVGTIRTTFSF
jgi:Carbohydrate-selective porin, OprB family/S-layer homology domain